MHTPSLPHLHFAEHSEPLVLDLGRLLVGLIIVCVGTLYLMDAANVLDASGAIEHWWPMVVVAGGLLTLMERPPAILRGTLLTVAGTIGLLFTNDVLTEAAWRYVWPAAVIVAGVAIMAHWSGHAIAARAIPRTSSARPRCSAARTWRAPTSGSAAPGSRRSSAASRSTCARRCPPGRRVGQRDRGVRRHRRPRAARLARDGQEHPHLRGRDDELDRARSRPSRARPSCTSTRCASSAGWGSSTRSEGRAPPRARVGDHAPVSADPTPRAPRVSAALRVDTRVTPLELFFDLVFVLAVTQCTALMAQDPTWTVWAAALLVLGVLWWSWVGYAWLTSVVDPEDGVVRLTVFVAMAAGLVCALCVPQAFGDEAFVFACAYAVVRVSQLALSRWAAAATGRSCGPFAACGEHRGGAAPLFAASATDGALQGTLWGVALLVDMAVPYLFGAEGGSSSPGTSPSDTA